MSEQSFTIPRALNVGQIGAPGPLQNDVPPYVTIQFPGDWPDDLRERVAVAIRWAATRAALSSAVHGDPFYLERWERQNPLPDGLKPTRTRGWTP